MWVLSGHSLWRGVVDASAFTRQSGRWGKALRFDSTGTVKTIHLHASAQHITVLLCGEFQWESSSQIYIGDDDGGTTGVLLEHLVNNGQFSFMVLGFTYNPLVIDSFDYSASPVPRIVVAHADIAGKKTSIWDNAGHFATTSLTGSYAPPVNNITRLKSITAAGQESVALAAAIKGLVPANDLIANPWQLFEPEMQFGFKASGVQPFQLWPQTCL
jgi:hypothetical protein